MTDLAGAQQKQDRGPGPTGTTSRHVTPGLTVMAALGMRSQIERGDHRRGIRGGIAQIDHSFGTVWPIPGFFENSSNHAVSFGWPGRHGSDP